MPLVSMVTVLAPAAPSSSEMARRALDREPVEADARTTKDLQKCVDRLADITGDRADAIADAACILDGLKPGERVIDAARPFERLLLAADGMRSDAVREAYALARAGTDPDERREAIERLADACNRDMGMAVAQAKTLFTLVKDEHLDDLSGTWAAILREVAPQNRGSVSAAMQKVVAGGHDLKDFRRLARSSGDPTAALADLARVGDLRKKGVEDPVGLLQHLRANRTPDVDAALALLAVPSEDAREARRESFDRLLEVEADAGRAREDLEWILASGVPTDKIDDATERFLRLRDHATVADRPAVRETFAVVEKAVLEEPQGWLARVLGRRHPAEKAVEQVMRIEPSAAEAVKHLRVVEQHRAKGETLADGLQRYRDLMLLDELEDAATAVTAYDSLATEPTAGDDGPGPRWDRFRSLAKTAGSVKAAHTAWLVMSAAATKDEMSAREAAFRELVAMEHGNGRAAQTMLDAMKTGLGPADPIADAVRIMKSLRASNDVTRASVIYRTSVGWRNLPGNPFTTLEQQTAFFDSIFSKCGSDGNIRSVVERMERPVGDETLFARAAVLRDLINTQGSASTALKEYDWMAQTLPGSAPFADLAQAYTLLFGTVRGRGVDSRALFTWLVDLRTKDERFKDDSLQDMIHALATVLLLNNDLEQAKAAFLKREVEAGTVEQGEEEVVIGGIRVPKKKGNPS